jgi:hypothetical protein
MFAYLKKMNRNVINLYTDDNNNDDEYLFNTETMDTCINQYKPPDVLVIYEDIPPQFNYN